MQKVEPVTEPSSTTSSSSPTLTIVLRALLGVLCIVGFYDIARGYGGFQLVYGLGSLNVHPNELVMYLWYLTLGLPAALFFASALLLTAVPERLEQILRHLLVHRWFLGGILTLFVVSVLAVWWFVLLGGTPITDDENTYRFIAQTLNQGQVINPLPADSRFFYNNFVVFNSNGWFGKYPIGFPALLAIGERVHAAFLINPLLSCLSLVLTYQIGVRMFSKNIAALGVVFLLLSPHFVFTSATLLSQPASTAFMLLGCYAMLQVYEHESTAWAIVGGIAWGYGVLIRPLPGALFLAFVGFHYLYVMHQRGWAQNIVRRLKPLLFASLPVVVCGVVFLWVNRMQTGSAGSTGYHSAHTTFGLFATKDGMMGNSLGGAFLRENFWLFGWPLSLLFAFFTRKGKYLGLLWGLIAADYAYRVLVPKTVVATTGPIYVTETVPLLCLASAAGVAFLLHTFKHWGWERGKSWLLAFSVGSTLVAISIFYPLHIQTIQESCSTWNTPFRMLREQKAKKKVLVFANYMIPRTFDASWAYHTPNPSPTLKDDVIFVRHPYSPNARAMMRAFWRKNFPNRQAWWFYHIKRQPFLIKLGDPVSNRKPVQ
ncbi:MAG: hypothetical protein EP343_23365 [Deltaproteobacteria bacterium]|nr:MAG: hypothetical protein EP343_23365 [Deltaproteobacteria bacterium]